LLILQGLAKESDKKYLQKLGENIKRLREAKGLSLRQLSYTCNVDNSKIAKIEKGQINITFTTLMQLANALEVHPSELLKTDFE
jgi:transcriptional regulator with XRE-family HTH domain